MGEADHGGFHEVKFGPSESGMIFFGKWVEDGLVVVG